MRGAYTEESIAVEAGHTYTLGFWAAYLDPNQADPACSHAAGHALQVQVNGQAAGTLLDEALTVAPCSMSFGSTHSYHPGGTGGSISVNQVGDVPQGPELATLRTTAAAGLPWELRSRETRCSASTEHGAEPSPG